MGTKTEIVYTYNFYSDPYANGNIFMLHGNVLHWFVSVFLFCWFKSM